MEASGEPGSWHDWHEYRCVRSVSDRAAENHGATDSSQGTLLQLNHLSAESRSRDTGRNREKMLLSMSIVSVLEQILVCLHCFGRQIARFRSEDSLTPEKGLFVFEVFLNANILNQL